MKTCIARFIFLGIFVSVMLTTDGFAQPGAKILSSKTPVTVEVANQPGSPLNISLVSVDISDVLRQRVKLTIQNVSQKAIRGHVFSIQESSSAGSHTSFFRKPFLSGSIHDQDIVVETANIRSDDFKLMIIVDYVAFSDSTGWGNDERKLSESLLGHTSGALSAVADAEASMQGEGIVGIEKLLAKPLADIAVPKEPDAKNRSVNWVRGFSSGYRSLIYFVLTNYKKPDFAARLEEARKNLE